MQNLKKIGKISTWLLFCIMAVAFLLLPGKRAEAEDRRLMYITAHYSGGVFVGDFIDLEKLTVKGYYTDGKYEDIRDYTLSTYIVEKEGNNKIIVYSGEKETTFYVNGRTVKRINAYYTEGSVTIGQSLDPDKLTVYATFSDGKSEKVTGFDIPNMIVYAIGRNEFTVIYRDQEAKFYVTGKDERRVSSIHASYSGPAVIVGNEPSREHIYVTAVYNDGTIEKVTEFGILPAKVEDEGSNIMVISYAGYSAEIRVQGRARRVVSLKAEYIGLPVVVGKAVAPEDIKVIATFNDDSTGEVTNFTLSSSIIEKVGDNLLTVFCDGKFTRMSVRGVESETIDYSHGLWKTVRDNGIISRVSIAVGQKADPDEVEIHLVDRETVKKAVHRLVKTDKYVAYEVVFNDPEQATFLPMTMKVTVPSKFDKDNFAVYYTPNKKTIMAQMNGEFLNSTTYEFKMFQPGTYIIADCTPLLYVESLYLDEGEEISMRLGRSYSLDPVVLPHTATNKEVEYSSSRPAIVTVDKYGTLTAKKTGTAVITIAAKDGSGKKCTLRVNVVEKKGKFDADIAELSDLLNEVHTAEEYIEFLEQLEENIEKKAYELSERKFEEYVKELESWIGAWNEDFIEMDDDEWLRLLELLYDSGEYSYGELFGIGGMFSNEIAELSRQLESIETVEDFSEFFEFFFLDLEEKLETWEEEEALLYLMALLNWGEQLQQNEESYTWGDEIWEQYEEWMYQMSVWM